jgi:hypothetical protein
VVFCRFLATLRAHSSGPAASQGTQIGTPKMNKIVFASQNEHIAINEILNPENGLPGD